MGEIVYAANFFPARHQSVSNVRADKTGNTGYQVPGHGDENNMIGASGNRGIGSTADRVIGKKQKPPISPRRRGGTEKTNFNIFTAEITEEKRRTQIRYEC